MFGILPVDKWIEKTDKLSLQANSGQYASECLWPNVPTINPPLVARCCHVQPKSINGFDSEKIKTRRAPTAERDSNAMYFACFLLSVRFMYHFSAKLCAASPPHRSYAGSLNPRECIALPLHWQRSAAAAKVRLNVNDDGGGAHKVHLN